MASLMIKQLITTMQLLSTGSCQELFYQNELQRVQVAPPSTVVDAAVQCCVKVSESS
jgi:hypothetical protein